MTTVRGEKERKKMIEIKVPLSYLRATLEAYRELIDNTANEEIIREAQENITMTRKYIRYGEPRNREMRKLFPIKKKEYKKWGW
jgi:hypothetical protein